MQITFYQFGKRTNSTKLVNVQGETFNHCELKGGTSMFNPSIIVHDVPAAWTSIWNYCHIPLFGRFYFINNWQWLNGVWECTCVCDVLATYKTEIGNMTEYITRSASAFDGNIIDTAYASKTNVSYTMSNVPIFFQSRLDNGFYIIGIIGNDSTATQGAITYYQMTPAQMARLREFMLSTTFLQDQGLVGLDGFMPADGIKVIYNPYQYIVSCKWFPFPVSAIDDQWKTSVNVIHFGWWDTGTGFPAYRLNDSLPSYQKQEYVTVTFHPNSATKGNYLNHAPFTQRVLRFPPFGDIALPDEYFESGGNDRLSITVNVDWITGLSYMTLFAVSTAAQDPPPTMLLSRAGANLGVDIQLAQVGIDYLATSTSITRNNANMVSSAANALSGISLLHPITSGIRAGAELGTSAAMYETNMIDDFIRSSAPQLLTSGSNGSLAAFKEIPYLCSTFYIQVEEDNTQLGRPLCQRRQINTLSGFMMCRNPDADIPCFDIERELINRHLTIGFFYE